MSQSRCLQITRHPDVNRRDHSWGYTVVHWDLEELTRARYNYAHKRVESCANATALVRLKVHNNKLQIGVLIYSKCFVVIAIAISVAGRLMPHFEDWTNQQLTLQSSDSSLKTLKMAGCAATLRNEIIWNEKLENCGEFTLCDLRATLISTLIELNYVSNVESIFLHFCTTDVLLLW